MKVCLACSAGGHLTELLALKESWKGFDTFWLSDYRTNAIELGARERVHYVWVPRRNPLQLLVNIVQSLRVFLQEKPDVVVTSGADVAVPFCLWAKLFGKKLVYIESFCRVEEPSLSGKILYRFSDRFFVQWPQLKKFFPKARYVGSVFS